MALAWQNYRWAEALINTLAISGCRHFFIAPGSRNAPLSMACLRLAGQRDFTCHTHFDERSLAFAALGAIKAGDAPAVVITTSGSAVANLLPATVEASQLGLPLILLTADRPPELIDVGANQAIQQPGLFSHFVRWSTDLPLPAAQDTFSGLQALANRLADIRQRHPGPVHLNVPLREPLYADFSTPDPRFPSWPVVAKPPSALSDSARLSLQPLTPPVLLVAGQLNSAQADAVLATAEAGQFPVIADIGSQLRLRDHPLIVPAAHYLAQSSQLFNRAGTVVQFGGRLVSKPVNQWLASTSAKRYLISEGEQRLDPDGNAHQIQLRASDWPALISADTDEQTAFNQQVTGAGFTLSQQLQTQVAGCFSEFSVIQSVSELIPAGQALMLGNSLAVRLFDQIALQRPQAPVVFCNRGASGIDGLIATSAGIALAGTRPVTAVIGDLSALYDLNSLAWLRRLRQTFVLVILNNDGGQIFSMLPAAQQTDVFDDAFAQPHGLEFGSICSGFGIDYHQVNAVDLFRQRYRQACAAERPCVIEVTLPNDAFYTHQASLQRQIHD